MTNLGTLPGKLCSYAPQINSKDQVTDSSDDDCADGNSHASLWENAGPMIDLNDLVIGADMTLGGATGINDRGEITGVGVFANGDFHAFLLIPCDQNPPDVDGCDYSLVEGNVAATGESRRDTKPVLSPAEIRRLVRLSRQRSSQWTREFGAARPKFQ